LPILRGTLDLLVLKALQWQPLHALEITTWLEARSGGRLEVDDSALIQALHRMEARRLVTAEWGITGNDRRARYYKMTAAGRAYLKEQGAELARDVAAIGAVLALSRR
jgi:DNA-binding PadR family transcriptional regulator